MQLRKGQILSSATTLTLYRALRNTKVHISFTVLLISVLVEIQILPTKIRWFSSRLLLLKTRSLRKLRILRLSLAKFHLQTALTIISLHRLRVRLKSVLLQRWTVSASLIIWNLKTTGSCANLLNRKLKVKKSKTSRQVIKILPGGCFIFSYDNFLLYATFGATVFPSDFVK